MPNKSYIEFRLNPSAIKEEALNIIPWPIGTVAREMYKNPDGSVIETLKQVGRETPFIGSLLRGEYGDAAKEAILFGSPVKLNKGSKAIRKRKDTQYYMDGDGHIYHETKGGLINDSEGGKKYRGWELSDLGRNLEDSEKASKFVIDNDLKFASELEIDNMTPANKAMREEAQKLIDREYAINDYTYRDKLVQAAKAEPGLLDPGDVIYTELGHTVPYAGKLFIKEPNSNHILALEGRGDVSNIEPYATEPWLDINSSYLSPYKPYRNSSLDRRILESDRAKYNINHELEPDYIPFHNIEQYVNDLSKADAEIKKARAKYIESMYGPLPDDIFTNTGRDDWRGEYIKHEAKHNK